MPIENHLSLSELNTSIKEELSAAFPDRYWIVAEIGEIKFNRNGHAYLELIEKEANTDKIKAKARANIWSYTLRMLKPYFETTTNQELVAGLKVLVNVSVEFHEIYGFNLTITDIDPNYTLGDIERRRLEIINRLEEEGIIRLNKDLGLPFVIQKMAIISSENAAGYEDFMKQLDQNSYGYKFYTKLFPAFMQGEKTESSIIAALEQIYNYNDFFEVVIIIRGGGARSDLMSFDKYFLAANIAQFPIPVISGIGHEKDTSIVDLVSHTSLKTPTAVAEFVITNNADFEMQLQDSFESIQRIAIEMVELENDKLNLITQSFIPKLQQRLSLEKTSLLIVSEKLQFNVNQTVSSKKHQINKYKSELFNIQKINFRLKQRLLAIYVEKLKFRNQIQVKKQLRKLEFYLKNIEHLNPQNILKKGYSITKLNNQIVKSSRKLKAGDEIETIFMEGEIKSTVKIQLD